MQKFNTAIGGLAALGLMTGVAMAASSGPGTDHAASIAACTTANEYQPVELLAAVDDGRGNAVVWLEDVDGDWWMCNADSRGAIYAYELVGYDLLEGAGAELIGLTDAAYEPGMPRPNPMRVAERVCLEVMQDDAALVVSSRQDGLGDYTVFIQAGDELALCNASGEAAIYAFAPIGDPLDLVPIS